MFPVLRAQPAVPSGDRRRTAREAADARDYTDAGLPWFEHYGGDLTALDGAKKLAGLDSVAARKLKQGEGILADNDPVTPAVVRRVGAARVREGEF